MQNHEKQEFKEVRTLTTIRKVAKDASVSIATVSRVLNNQPGVSEDVRSRVLESVNRCGYIANVGRRATMFVALAYTGPSSVASPYDAALCAGMVAAMDESDLDLVFLNMNRDKRSNETYTQYFLRKGARGVILRTTHRTRNICEEITAEGFPCLVVGDHFDGDNVSYVYCNSKISSQQGIEHLIGLGHRRIALAISDLVQDSDHMDRREAYELTLKEHGIELDKRLYFRIPPSRPDGAQVIRKMISMSEPPTAVFVTDPYVAMGALNEALRMGIRVPADLSILGFDDSDVRNYVYPRMTAICQDAQQLGIEAFRAIESMIQRRNAKDGQLETIQDALPTWLEVNDTTGKPSYNPVQIMPDGTRVGRSD